MAALMEDVIQADYDRANEWAFIECRHCSEYEGDFRDDLAADFAAHRLAHSEPRPVAGHSDDEAVDRFAASMKAKLAVARGKGRGGWDDPAQCSTDFLRQLLHEHVAKGDPVDVANFCMMLAHYGASTATHSPAPTEAACGKIDGNDIWEALFGILKGNVPDALTEDVCAQLAAALSSTQGGAEG